MCIYVYTYAIMKVHIYVHIYERVKSQKITATQLHNIAIKLKTSIPPYTCTHTKRVDEIINKTPKKLQRYTVE